MSRNKGTKRAVSDRGYRGKREVNGRRIILPGKTLKRDTHY
jgi:transposase, IS5 family